MKHIVCFGDSNTHGYCADPADCADGGDRFNEQERWTCLLQEKLGSDYRVLEEGLSGRTTVFDDPIHEGLRGLDDILSCLMSHEPVDLLIIMLGTNDTKSRFGANAAAIGIGMGRLIDKARSIPAWRKSPNILLIAPPHIGPGMERCPDCEAMGLGCPEKSAALAPHFADVAKTRGCAFLDSEGVAEFNKIDCMHLTAKGHRQLAEKLAEIAPTLI